MIYDDFESFFKDIYNYVKTTNQQACDEEQLEFVKKIADEFILSPKETGYICGFKIEILETQTGKKFTLDY